MNRIQIIDILSRKDVWKYYQYYQNTQWYSYTQMNEFQLKKLKKLLAHCFENVPFYMHFSRENKITIDDIYNLDILKNFPIIDKAFIKNNYSDFIPKNLNRIKNVKKTQTSGTTGGVLFHRDDRQTRSSIWGSFLRFRDWMHIDINDKTFSLMGGHVARFNLSHYLKNKLFHILENSKSYSPYKMTDRQKVKIKKFLATKKPALIRGYSQSLFELSKEFEAQDLRYTVKAITTTAEPLLDHHRIQFRKIFNCEAFDQYGCGEIGGIAYECDCHQGLHITEERVIIETDDDDEVILTDLDNFAFPFIRFKNGDQLLLSSKQCKCGRKSKLIEKVLGRTCDSIVGINGFKLHWAYFYHLIFDSQIAFKRNILKFQVVQKSKSEILFQIVSSECLSKEDKSFLSTNIKKKLGNMEIRVLNVPDILPTKGGKYRPIISEIL